MSGGRYRREAAVRSQVPTMSVVLGSLHPTRPSANRMALIATVAGRVRPSPANFACLNRPTYP
jgi:hypothetical protein